MPFTVFPRVEAASSSSSLDGLLQKIIEKNKPNNLDRSTKDWGDLKGET
jgi:hypothetical protein